MGKGIKSSVGKGGANVYADVLTVQMLISQWIALGTLRGKILAPVANGKCDSTTIEAIGAFQRLVLGMAKPDKRVDPDGKTIRRLVQPVLPVSVPPDPSPKALRPRGDPAGDIGKTAFLWIYECNGTETLEQIGRKHDYSLDYGPIAAFPLNPEFHDPRAVPGKGVKLFIPWPRHLLQRIRDRKVEGLAIALERTRALMAEVDADEKDINEFFLKIDLMAFAASMMASISLVVLEGFGFFGPKAAQLTAEELTRLSVLRLIPNRDVRQIELMIFLLDKAGSKAQLFSTAMLPAPKRQELGVRYYLRHAFGAWNPSYWVQTITAIATQDIELWMVGPGALANRDRTKIYRQYRDHERLVLSAIRKIQRQLTCTYYSSAALISLPLPG
jgi:hypothetical protein